jgi:DNA-binding FadR family transcriptional regulator
LHTNLDSDILRYIIQHQMQPGERLPTLTELSREMGASVSKVREDLAVARMLGLVTIKPRTGIQVQEFDFEPAATLSVLYALGLNRDHFYDFAQLRKQIELGFWHEAVAQLTPDDIGYLRELITFARDKLNRVPIEVPFQEHRLLHLTFFKYLNNPFVQGILEAYWAAYKAFGLALYADLSYHRDVWDHHERMVECVAHGDLDGSYRALRDHMTLLRYSPDQSESSETERAASSIYQHFE